jgi:hypothetical protein
MRFMKNDDDEMRDEDVMPTTLASKLAEVLAS